MEPPYLCHDFRQALKGLSRPYALACLREDAVAVIAQPSGAFARRLKDNRLDYAAAQAAITTLFADQNFPAPPDSSDLQWRRDPLGRPFVEWTGEIERWANGLGLHHPHLHISNSHDGGAHLVLAAYGEAIAGIGVDAVWLPRLSLPGKGEPYLHRFARQFMSPEEYEAYVRNMEEEAAGIAADPLFEVRAGTPAYSDSIQGTVPTDLDILRVRTAAHFSLMEAASKACGTGLKIGAGMGRETSLPKQSLGAARLFPKVDLLFGLDARARLNVLDATRYEAAFTLQGEFLISAVILYKNSAIGSAF